MGHHERVSRFSDFVFGPLHFSRRDLVALTIMRGRDNGLADYNGVRKAFGFDPVKNWTDINPEQYAANPEVSPSVLDRCTRGEKDPL